MGELPLAKRLKVGEGEDEEEARERALREDPYLVPAEEVMRLCIINKAEDVLPENRTKIEESRWFCPGFTHQVFGQDEVVKGYESVKVKVYLHALTMHAFVEITSTGKQPGADDIGHALNENLGLQYTEDIDEFLKLVGTSGPLVERSLSNATTCTSIQVSSGEELEIVRFTPSEPSASVLKSLHDRLQAMPLLYVDGANYIDNTDSKWEIYLAIMKQGTSEANKTTTTVAGFCTVYSFYAYPERKRLRLSQILVFPPFQRKGIASAILKQVYENAVASEALDLTVEDPSEEFQLLRENIDVKRVVVSSPFYQDAVRDLLAKSKDMLANGIRADTLLLPKKNIYEKAERELKIHKAQLRKVWEILLYKCLEQENWPNGEKIIKEIVRSRLSSDMEEKRMQQQASLKALVEGVGGENFIMMRSSVPQQNFKMESTEEEKAQKREYDLEQIELRIQTLNKIKC